MKLTYREEEMEETDEGEEMERCGEEAKRMKKRDDQGSFGRRAGVSDLTFVLFRLCFHGNATEILFNRYYLEFLILAANR